MMLSENSKRVMPNKTIATTLLLAIFLISAAPVVTAACGSLQNPYSHKDKNAGSGGWNPRTKFIVSKIKACFQAHYACSTYPGSASSDHPGNAADCFPGPAGKKAVGIYKTRGDGLALWLVKNAKTLKVKYVIWYKRIWSLERASEGWRTCGTSSATCYGGKDITQAHYDHVHISVY